MAFFNFGTVYSSIMILLHSFIKSRFPEFMNWLSSIEFPFSVNHRTGKVDFAHGIVRNLIHSFDYTKYETINMCLFILFSNSVMSAFLKSIKPENQMKFILNVAIVMILCVAVILHVTIMSNLKQKHRFYYLKFGALFAGLFICIGMFIDYSFEISFNPLAHEIQLNKDIYLNLQYYFGYSFDLTDLITKSQIICYAVSFVLMVFSFASITSSLAAHRQMNLKIMTVSSKDANVIAVLENYRQTQRFLVLQVLSNVIFIVFMKKIILFGQSMIVIVCLFNIGMKYLLLPLELRMTFSKFTESAFQVGEEIKMKEKQLKVQKKENDFKERFKKVNSNCMKMIKDSVRILIVVLGPFLIICVIFCLLIFLHNSFNYRGFIPKVDQIPAKFPNFYSQLKFIKHSKTMCLSKSFLSSFEFDMKSPKLSEVEVAIDFYKTFFLANIGLIKSMLKLVLFFFISFETTANIILFMFMKKINY